MNSASSQKVDFARTSDIRKRLDLNAPVLECNNLCISYFTRAGEIPAVIDFNLTVNAEEAVGLVGESGCGKSTVAFAVMNYLGHNGRIVGGDVKFMGQSVLEMSEEDLRDLRGSLLAMIYQEPMAALNPSMKIAQQLMEVPMTHEDISPQEARERALKVLEDVRLPDPERIIEAYPHQISGGQQQRVVIGMSLLSNPKLLLLDEPTTALDVTVEAGVVEVVKTLARKYGTSLVYISHNLGLIRETCDRISVMYSGVVVETGTVHNVFNNMSHPYTNGLFSSIPLPATNKFERPLKAIKGQLPLPTERPPGCFFGPRCDFFEAGTCDNGDVPMLDTAAGNQVRCKRLGQIDFAAAGGDVAVRENKLSSSTEKVLEIENLTKHYHIERRNLGKGKKSGGSVVKANEEVSFSIPKGKTLALVGESGCGKSTLAKVLIGLEDATSGSVKLLDEDIAKTLVGKRNRKLIRANQMIFQNPFDTLNPSHSVGRQLTRVLRKLGSGATKEEVQNRVLELLDMVKLPRDFAIRRPRQLSGGQKQRVGIARAFAGDPALIIADEPVSALDVSVQAAVTELITDLQTENETTMLFISHDLSLVRYLADEVVVMYLGVVVEKGTTDEVFSPPYHPYTEALLSAAPIADTSIVKKKIVLSGELPSPLNPPVGCPFSTRCPHHIGEICDTTKPPIQTFGDGHKVACHLDRSTLEAMQPVFSTVKETT